MVKQCFCCGQTKPISEFYKHPRMADGYLGKCKECQKLNTKEARARNPDHYREFDKQRSMLPHRVQARAEYQQTERGKEAHQRANKKWTGNHPNRRAAAQIVNNAIKGGRLVRLPCFVCGKKAHAHHPDYDRPLDVIWLCPKHHKEAHALIGDPDEPTIQKG